MALPSSYLHYAMAHCDDGHLWPVWLQVVQVRLSRLCYVLLVSSCPSSKGERQEPTLSNHGWIWFPPLWYRARWLSARHRREYKPGDVLCCSKQQGLKEAGTRTNSCGGSNALPLWFFSLVKDLEYGCWGERIGIRWVSKAQGHTQRQRKPNTSEPKEGIQKEIKNALQRLVKCLHSYGPASNQTTWYGL